MKKYKCDSDIGSVLVGNETVRFALPNMGGDGVTTLFIKEKNDSKEDFEKFYNKNKPYTYGCFETPYEKLEFVTCIEGEFNVFDHDCSSGTSKDVIATLNGRYGVKNGNWVVVLDEWENYDVAKNRELKVEGTFYFRMNNGEYTDEALERFRTAMEKAGIVENNSCTAISAVEILLRVDGIFYLKMNDEETAEEATKRFITLVESQKIIYHIEDTEERIVR